MSTPPPRRIAGSMTAVAVLLQVALTLACGRSSPPAPGPKRLLEIAPVGAKAQLVELEVKGERRRGLGASARYRLPIPRKALLVLALAASSPSEDLARGFFHLRVRVDGRDVGERRINLRTERGLRATSLAFEGTGGMGLLDFELGLARGSGEALPVLPGLKVAVVDPVLWDVSSGNDRRGVVLVSLDTLRRDHVGLYGYPKPTTPNLDALGAEGLVCDDAVSVSSWTLPSHFSMVTSVDPAAHGAVHRERGFNHRVPTLARALRDSGFTTHAITSHLYVSPEYGFDDGFDGFDYRYNRPGIEVAERAMAFLEGVDERPFFLFLHFYDPHLAYAPPLPLLRLFEPRPYTGTISGKWDELRTWTPKTTTPADLAHVLALYDGDIRYADGQLGRVLRHLRDQGLDRRTLVLATSDHGEEFLEHGAWEHQKTLYEEMVRVPLLLQGPGVPRGRRVRAQVSLLDVAPTILDWAGVPPLPTQRGRSLLKPLKEAEAYGETDHGHGNRRKLFLRGGAESFKVVLTFDRSNGAPVSEEWFDLRTDPGELHPLPPPGDATITKTRLFRRWQEAGRAGALGPPVDLTPEQIEALRALGYAW